MTLSLANYFCLYWEQWQLVDRLLGGSEVLVPEHTLESVDATPGEDLNFLVDLNSSHLLCSSGTIVGTLAQGFTFLLHTRHNSVCDLDNTSHISNQSLTIFSSLVRTGLCYHKMSCPCMLSDTRDLVDHMNQIPVKKTEENDIQRNCLIKRGA